MDSDYKDLFNKLRQIDDSIIISPSSSFVKDYCDAISRKKDIIYEFFIPTQKEYSDYDLLVKRVFFSKLVSVAKTSTVLVLHKDAVNYADFMSKIFDYIVPVDKLLDEYEEITKDKKTKFKVIGKKVKSNVLDNYYRNRDLYLNSVCCFPNMEAKKLCIRKENFLSYKGIASGREIILKDTTLVSNCLISDKSSFDRNFKSKIDDLLKFSVLDSYALDNGNFIFKGTSRFMNYINVDFQLNFKEAEVIESYINNLLFAGILPIKIDNLNMISECEYRIGEYLNENK